jgi:hypothetical protein
MRELAEFLGAKEYLKDIPKKPELKQAKNFFSKARRAMDRFLGNEMKVKPTAFPRKGVVGDWKNHFDDKDLEFILSEVGDTMERLNYN